MNNIQVYCIAIFALKTTVAMFSQNGEDKVNYVISSTILCPIFGRLFGWW